MNIVTPPKKLKPSDFATDQEVRWCPGCGDYAILKAVQKALADMDAKPENTVFVSGIGCSSRFPYYMATYGFHTIHGRAPAIATGIKLANPDLDVWIVTGDGDGLSIGGNHLLHTLRRNPDVQILLFNNEIYGLTKGQYSPTSREGTRSPSSPKGSVDHPVHAASLALGAGARFVARTIDTQQKHLPEVLKRAHAHRGASFVEIFQNCIVYNDGAFSAFADRAVMAERTVDAVHGQALRFGENREKGLRLNPKTLALEAVGVGSDGVGEEEILVHDETNPTLATMLAAMEPPALPVAIGVLYCAPASSYDSQVADLRESAGNRRNGDDLNALLRRGHTWTVDGDG